MEETSEDSPNVYKTECEASNFIDNSESEPLLPKNDDDKTGYRKHERLKIRTSCRHWIIGPVIFTYVFSMVCSYYALVEYTKEYFIEKEFTKANLTQDNISAGHCGIDPDDKVYLAETRATAAASTWNLHFAAAAGVPAVVSNLVLGSYTDALGRKFLLTIAIIGTSLRLGIAAIIVHLKADIAYILIACFVEGCTGQYATALQVSFAYIADITEPGRGRIFGIVFIELFLCIGVSSASLVGGYLVDWKGYLVTFSSMAIMMILTFLIMLFALPESLTKEHRQRNRSCVHLLKTSVSFFVVNDSENRRWKYQTILLIHALCNMSYIARLPTETLYQLAPPFCWSPTKIGVYAAVRTLALMFIGLGSVKLLQRCLNEIWICMVGTVSYGAAFLWTAFVADDVTFYIIIGVGCFGPLSTTMHRGILSHLTPPEKQGAIFSTVGTLEVATTVLANVVTSSVYAATVSVMRGAVFLVLGSLDVACVILLVMLKVGWNLEKKRDSQKPSFETVIVWKSEQKV